MPLRLLHFADTHIGIENYGRLDPATGRHTRLLDFQRSLETAVDLALEAEVDAALFAGDAYRNCYPNPTHQQVFAEAIGRLTAAGVPLVMVAGNHDLPVAWGRATPLDIFTTLAGDRVQLARRPELLRLETRSGPLQVACLPWPTPVLLRADEAGFELSGDDLRERLQAAIATAIGHLAEALDPAVPSVLLGHLCAAGAVFSGSEKMALAGGDPTVSLGVLANRRFDYVALGHIHRFQDLNPGAVPPVVYPGSLDRIDFGEAGDVKGVCLVTIGDGPTPTERVTSYDHRPVGARPFLALKVELPAGVEPTDYLVSRIAGRATAEAVVKLTYTCTDEQYEQLDLPAVRRALEPAFLVAGMIRERTAEPLRPRVEVTEHHGLEEALGRWLETRPELAGVRTELIEAALALERDLEAAEAAGEETDT